MSHQWDEFDRVVSASVGPVSVPLTKCVMWVEKDGTFGEESVPVVGVLVEVVESYSRVRHGCDPSGPPGAGCTPRQLADQGYRLLGRATRLRWVTCDPVNDGHPDDGSADEGCVEVAYHPAGSELGADVRRRMESRLRAKREAGRA